MFHPMTDIPATLESAYVSAGRQWIAATDDEAAARTFAELSLAIPTVKIDLAVIEALDPSGRTTRLTIIVVPESAYPLARFVAEYQGPAVPVPKAPVLIIGRHRHAIASQLWSLRQGLCRDREQARFVR